MPDATPGLAGRPLAKRFAASRVSGCSEGDSSARTCSGQTRSKASWSSMRPASRKANASRTAACGERLATRACNSHRRPSSTVNSMSCTSLPRRSSCSAAAISSANTSGCAVRNASIGRGSKVPDTTSSPCAPGSHSPIGSGAPVEGLRLNRTPVPESRSRFPNTIACTMTAVPPIPSSPWWRSVGRGARAVPRREHRLDRAAKLNERIVGHGAGRIVGARCAGTSPRIGTGCRRRTRSSHASPQGPAPRRRRCPDPEWCRACRASTAPRPSAR